VVVVAVLMVPITPKRQAKLAKRALKTPEKAPLLTLIQKQYSKKSAYQVYEY
jgi:hypothetical protein